MSQNRQDSYALTQKMHGKEVADLCRKNGYSCSWHPEWGTFLMWNDALEKEGKPWETYFTEFRLIEQKDKPWPSATLATPLHATPENASEAIEAHHERLRAVAAHFRERQEKGELIGVEADLATARDALEKQIRRTERVVSEPLSKIRRALKVWINEAERAVREAQGSNIAGASTPPPDSSTEEWNQYMLNIRPHTTGGVRDAAVLLWGMVKGVSGAEDLERVLKDRLARDGVPEVVVESTRSAVLHFYQEEIFEPLKSAQQLDQKRVLYEKNLLRILHDDKVMSPEEVEKMLAGSKDSSSRPVNADHHAKRVAPHIDRAESLAHAYALVLATQSNGTLDEAALEEYRKKKNKNERDVIRGAWRKWGYLDTGPHTPQKLPMLKQRVKDYHENGTFPTPPESS